MEKIYQLFSEHGEEQHQAAADPRTKSSWFMISPCVLLSSTLTIYVRWPATWTRNLA